MRASRQDETLHGTGAGQAPVDRALADAYGLTVRQAQCATLLRYGVSAGDLAARIGVSRSTLQKHLSALREKLGVRTTQDLVARLQDSEADDNIAAYHSWPPAPLTPEASGDGAAGLVEKLRGKLHLHDMLDAFRDHLAAKFHVQYVFYSFIPLSVPGLFRGDLFNTVLAPQPVEAAYRAVKDPLQYPAIQELFEKPDGVALLDGLEADYVDLPEEVAAFYRACLAEGVRFGVTFGFPAGTSYVGVSLSMGADCPDPARIAATRGDELRAAAMTLHGCAWSFGALAASFGLTVRERDALSFLAQGFKAADAAARMEISERAFVKHLANARKKFNAQTNAEAICKATAANALVFR